MTDTEMGKIDGAVLALVRACEHHGFEMVRDYIMSLPDELEAEPARWEIALIEGIGDAVRYAQADREAQSILRVAFASGGSMTFEWQRGVCVDGSYRAAVIDAVTRLLDGERPGDG